MSSRFVTAFVLLSCLSLVVIGFQCFNIQDGRIVQSPYLTQECDYGVAACITKRNKGSNRWATGCDNTHKCAEQETHFKDETYDYRCCYNELCNSTGATRIGLATVALLCLKQIIL